LAALPCLEIERLDWQRAGELLRALRQRGAEVPLTDALLTALAERHRLAILTLDRHFRILGARLADPLPPGEEEPDPQVG
jgi:predicted nucleic acid-binding protein